MNDNRDKQMDARLDALLRALPDKPVATNFTARVLQTVEHQERPRVWRLLVPDFNWLLRVEIASLAVAVGVLTYSVRAHAEHTQFAKSLAAVSQVASLPSPDTLKDFDAIRHLSQTPAADTELLALLK
jgi:hypothetical protein